MPQALPVPSPGTFKIERAKTNYQLQMPDKASIQTHFPRLVFSNSGLTLHIPGSQPYPPPFLFKLYLTSLLLSPKVRNVHRGSVVVRLIESQKTKAIRLGLIYLQAG